MSKLPAEMRFHSVISQIATKINDKIIEMEGDGRAPVASILSGVAVGYIKNYQDKKKLIVGFIRKSHQHWDKIRNRDMSFFVDNAGDIFGDIPVSGISQIFNKLIYTKRDDGELYISEEERKKWWLFFDSLTNICISYAHDNAGPQSKIEKGKEISYYTKDPFEGQDEGFPQFDILVEANKNDDAARKNGVFKFSVRKRLEFPRI